MILDVEQVTMRFGGLTAVKEVSFGLREGEILGLIGPNGAGKTTLFNGINGVYPVTSGSVTFRGGSIHGLPTWRIARLGLARTHQIVRPLAELTVRENVVAGACFGRERLGLRDAERVADEVLERVELASKADLPAGKLNLAQKKRLELARALAARPYLLLLDEVLAGLNPSEVSTMLDTLREVRSRGVTLILIEHIMHAVMSLSDRVLVLHCGERIAEGTPEQVTRDARVVEAYLGDPSSVGRAPGEA